MSHVALHFALSAALLVGALLAMGGAVIAADSHRMATDTGLSVRDVRPIALGMAAFGLLTFMAAACAIIGVIGAA